MASTPKEICQRHEQMSTEMQEMSATGCMSLESVHRISKLPVVESTLQASKHIYDRVKDFNGVTNWTISTAESTVCRAVEVGKPYAAPIVHSLEGPLKRVDGILCSGLDFVESKVPAVKLPPSELYNSTKDYIASNPTVVSACSVVKPAVASAKSCVSSAGTAVQGATRSVIEPVLEGAKWAIEPTLEQAKCMIEPYIETSLETAGALRDYGHQKIEAYLSKDDEVQDEGHAESANH